MKSYSLKSLQLLHSLLTVNEKEYFEKLSLIRNTASEMGAPLFINASIDVYLKANDLSDEEKL